MGGNAQVQLRNQIRQLLPRCPEALRGGQQSHIGVKPHFQPPDYRGAGQFALFKAAHAVTHRREEHLAALRQGNPPQAEAVLIGGFPGADVRIDRRYIVHR